MGNLKAAWRPRHWLSMLILILLISGCAGVGLEGLSLDKLVSRQSDPLAAAVMDGAGSSVIMIPDSQFGPGQATLGESYLSAAGLPCRQVFFTATATGERHNLAVCTEKEGLWTTAPDVFAQSPGAGGK